MWDFLFWSKHARCVSEFKFLQMLYRALISHPVADVRASVRNYLQGCIRALLLMISGSILGWSSFCAPDQFLRRKHNSSYRSVCISATFIDDESEAINVELPMVSTYNDGLLASQILKKEDCTSTFHVFVLIGKIIVVALPEFQKIMWPPFEKKIMWPTYVKVRHVSVMKQNHVAIAYAMYAMN